MINIFNYFLRSVFLNKEFAADRPPKSACAVQDSTLTFTLHKKSPKTQLIIYVKHRLVVWQAACELSSGSNIAWAQRALGAAV